MNFSNYLDIHPDVENALKNNEPVVALESTIISHGMPYPKNVETALMVEETVRSNSAVPATIAIINGRLKVGLTTEEIEFLATNEDVKKVSRRDVAPSAVLVQKSPGEVAVAPWLVIISKKSR